MTFDEFFKKKRVDVAALEKAEPLLFSEFKAHYEQMGEKSFDHTKKYWFNKIRRRFPLAAEIKTEKPHIGNPIAEQTITESLTDIGSATQSPKVGFVPRFKAANIPTAAVDDRKESVPGDTNSTDPANAPAPAAASPAGFTPRFTIKPKPDKVGSAPDLPAPGQAETAASNVAGFTPRFKTQPKAEKEENAHPADETPASDVSEKKPAYKPRFVPPKPKQP